MNLTDAQRELLEDKFVLWDRAAREGPMISRDYNQRAAEALRVALSIVSAHPSPEMGEISRAAVLRMIGDAFQDGGGCVEGHDWSWDVVEFKAVANKLADKLKENGLSREGLGGLARSQPGAAGPSDCAEGDARLSDGGANPSGGSGA